jgi:hypothetical protein
VYVDGVLKATVNTQSSITLDRVIAYKVEWATSGPHKIKIVNKATAGHPRISVDGFVTRN